ncbi:MAG: NAD-glutamate dehydrogenase [Alphaproteobacteria bacterium]
MKIAEEKSASSVFQKFVSLFFQQFSLEDFEFHDMELLYHLAAHAFETLEKSPSGVHVYNPALSNVPQSLEHTIVEITHPHIPFLGDSISAYLNNHKIAVHNFAHLILHVVRDSKGSITDIDFALPGQGEKSAESLIFVELHDLLDQAEIDDLTGEFKCVLDAVTHAVNDWQKMRDQNQKASVQLPLDLSLAESETNEIQEFLRWIDQGNFTFLGYRFYDFSNNAATCQLGVLRNFKGALFGDNPQTEADILQQAGQDASPLSITKTMVKSVVHRAVPMDVIRLSHFDESGKVTGEHQFFGLFTSSVYTQSIQSIPLLRSKAKQVLQRAGLLPEGHDGKAFLHVLESFPRDEVFQTNVEKLYGMVRDILNLKTRQKVALFVRPDTLGHFVSCLVYIPRDRYSATLRKTISAMIADCLKGSVVSFHTEIGGDLEFAQIHITIATPIRSSRTITCDLGSVEKLLSQYTLSWIDRLGDLLSEQVGHKAAKEMLNLFGDAFTESYKEKFSMQETAVDLDSLRQALEQDSLQIQIHETGRDQGHFINFKFFNPNYALALSDILPILENFGLHVFTESAYKVQPTGDKVLWIHHLSTSVKSGQAIQLNEVRPHLIEALTEAWFKRIDNDGLNALILTENLSARQVVILRAYLKYMAQIQWVHDPDIVEACLVKYGDIARQLVDFFYARFAPESEIDEKKIFDQIEKSFDQVTLASDEHILQGFLSVIQGTVRTNYFQKDKTGFSKDYVSFKIQSDLLDTADDIKPMYEIFVYATWMEGIHLRGGKVARGGIRWSDRKEDYRKEVLELMKAQMVKNSVIVPLGAKGGFVVRKSLDNLSYDQKQQEAIFCYKTLIRGMLDLTDNWVNGQIIPPTQVKRRDADDHYLVVAADKGTATFSDIANGLSAEYGFWMGDAFASGGSAGYDHKKIGITSRGAWESVKRHFQERGVDETKTPFTVVGVGDMSGDVFGNGMLLSKNIKMIGAFNHAHIFIDPTPDLEKSFSERQRLFQLPRSGWNDYDPKALSKGGAVFERSAKTLKISPEIQALLDFSKDVVTPNELAVALLKAPVDLLWLGGIGTYVKSASETHQQVGDKTNDALRINGEDLQCKIVGEGANLGFTQKGRIEYALKGGALNRDAIDNSAGVDCSDHEVNLKILFQPLLHQGKITLGERDQILKDVADEVTQLILQNNYLQNQAISLVQSSGAKNLGVQRRFITTLEGLGILNRGAEFLPSDIEMEEREKAGIGLTRPEISVLIAYAKMFAYEEVLASDLPDLPRLEETLLSYFPVPIQQKFKDEIMRHPLRREIISTLLVNDVVNQKGPTFLTEGMHETGKGIAENLSF